MRVTVRVRDRVRLRVSGNPSGYSVYSTVVPDIVPILSIYTVTGQCADGVGDVAWHELPDFVRDHKAERAPVMSC
jgi:hypothetical protein